MNFIARVIRFLFWLLVVSWSVALLKKLVAWMLRGATERAESAEPVRTGDFERAKHGWSIAAAGA